MTKRHLIIHIAILILCLVSPLWAGEDSNIPGEAVGSGGQNAPAQADKPYVILISIDGYRWDYPDLYPTPTIRKLIENGTRADSVLPVFPTLTFPNHYSIATGLYPEHHGLVANIFPNGDRDKWYVYKQAASAQDGDWYGGEPIWVTAEKQGMVSAAYFFVGTEADISGVHPSHWRRFSKDVGGEARVDQVLSWLAEPAITRPHMITLYFEDVDDHSHWYSPNSAEAMESIRRVDSYLSQLIAGISTLPVADRVNIVLVSDHGQIGYVEAEPFILDQHVNLKNTEIIEGGAFVFVYFDSTAREDAITSIRDTINGRWRNGHAWLAGEAPAAWKIGTNRRFPDLIVQAEPGYGVISSAGMAHKMNAGDHGWAPQSPGMHGIFIAAGPDLPAGRKIDRISVVDIYPLLTTLLGLERPEKLDSDPDLLGDLVEPGSGISLGSLNQGKATVHSPADEP